MPKKTIQEKYTDERLHSSIESLLVKISNVESRLNDKLLFLGQRIADVTDLGYAIKAKVVDLSEAKPQDAPKPFPFKIGKCSVLRSAANAHTVLDGRIVDVDAFYREGKQHAVAVVNEAYHRDQVVVFDEYGNCPYWENLKLSQP